MLSYSTSYNKKRGCYIFRYQTGDGATWGSKWASKAFLEHDRSAAVAWFEEWLFEYEKTLNTAVIVPIRKSVTLGRYWETWLEQQRNNRGIKPKTVQTYNLTIKNWILGGRKHYAIKDIPLEQINAGVVLAWINSLTGSASSKEVYIGVLKKMLSGLGSQHCSQNWIHPFDTYAVKEHLKGMRKNTAELESEEDDVIITIPYGHLEKFARYSLEVSTDRRLRVLFAYGTGMRDGEIQGLSWNNLDLEKGIVYVVRHLMKAGVSPISYNEAIQEGKTKVEIMSGNVGVYSIPKKRSRRAVPIHPELLKALKWWRDEGWAEHVGRMPQGEDAVFGRGARGNQANGRGAYCRPDSSAELQIDCDRLELDKTNLACASAKLFDGSASGRCFG